ncbi:MAG TPA: hypothetical protein PLK34_00385 [Candidatus Pacearchaeota archaeon]|nr:hypothetical protein [Candidatus Pacearchaeota archaeon]
MGTLEQVTRMRDEGMNDEDIIYNLREQGVSPKSISDALNQASIKAAVSGIRGGNELIPPQNDAEDASSQQFYSLPDRRTEAPASPEESPSEYIPARMYEPPAEQQQEYYSPREVYEPAPQQETYAPEAYAPAQGGYGGYMPGTNTETLIDISQQVVAEKTAELKRKIEDLEEFKTLAQTKIDYISERVKRIDFVLDKLQIAILDKVGSYGNTLESIKKEMSMMQESFSKTLNPLMNLTERSLEKSDKTSSSSRLKRRD